MDPRKRAEEEIAGGAEPLTPADERADDLAPEDERTEDDEDLGRPVQLEP
ncbi:MAG TPA: hypothetical protein VID28_12020 [Methylomirabilota bacterium]|jgi:hypothetical protein